MKTIYTILLVFIFNYTYSQCRDVYNTLVDCPTESDSLTVYKNALKVYNYYESNKDYLKTRSREVVTESEKRDVFEMQMQARKMFSVIRREVAKLPSQFSAGKPKPKYVDISFRNYYQEIDEYRFYQRELENQIINANAPMPMYDTRICPIIVNEYKCIDTSSEYYGDLVNIPLYIPVVVKPYMLLTASEQVLRNEILHIIPPSLVSRALNNDTVNNNEVLPIKIPKKEDEKRFAVKRSYDIVVNNKVERGYPVYMAYQYGGGALIGFLVDGKFRKIYPHEYKTYAVPPYAQKCLENNEELDKMLKIKFGGYYRGLL